MKSFACVAIAALMSYNTNAVKLEDEAIFEIILDS